MPPGALPVAADGGDGGAGGDGPTAAQRRLGIALLALALAILTGWVWFLARVDAMYKEATAAAPTRVYARPLVLRSGEELDRNRVEDHLAAAGYRTAPRGEAGGGIDAGEYLPGREEWWIHRRSFRMGPAFHPTRLLRIGLDREGRIARLEGWAGEGSNGEVERTDGVEAPPEEVEVGEPPEAGEERLSEALLEPPPLATLLGPEGRDRIPVSLEEVPDHLVRAVLAVEDRRFRDHQGVDLRRVAGAAWANLRAGRVTQGGSTLTQQLARSLFLSRERTLLRKLEEAAIAAALERRLDKEEILRAYLNHIYLGQDGGVAIHGVARAARYYFGKDVRELRVEESALLAGLIRAPNLYSPFQDTAAARKRRDLVLREMREAGAIGEEALARAIRTPVDPRRGEGTPRFAPYFGDYVRRELRERDPELDPATAGLTVIATLSPGLQEVAEETVRRGLAALERSYPYQARRGRRPLQAALVALEPETGAILAMVGGRDYEASQFNRAADALRQPGSVFKPVVALAALAGGAGEGPRYTLASLVEDEPLSVETPEGPWRPANYDGEFHGGVTLRRALELSRNVPFARLGMQVGPERIVATARALGIRSDLRAVPSIALGSSEVTLLEMTSAYGVLAAGGVRARPRAALRLLGPDRGSWEETAPDTARVFAAAEAYLLTSALEGVIRRGTGYAVRAHGYRGPVAGKTGTTDDFRDAWFVGYTPELAVGVWVGYDGGASLGMPGAIVALPIFADFLEAALGPEGGADFTVPEGIEVVSVDPYTGLRARGGWCDGLPEVFLEGTAPEEPCPGDWPLIGREDLGAESAGRRPSG